METLDTEQQYQGCITVVHLCNALKKTLRRCASCLMPGCCQLLRLPAEASVYYPHVPAMPDPRIDRLEQLRRLPCMSEICSGHLPLVAPAFESQFCCKSWSLAIV